MSVFRQSFLDPRRQNAHSNGIIPPALEYFGSPVVKDLGVTQLSNGGPLAEASAEFPVQEQVCHPLLSRPREDVQTVRHGTEDHTSVAPASTARSGYATCSQDCFAAMADAGRKEVANRLWLASRMSLARPTSEPTTSARCTTVEYRREVRQQAIDGAESSGDGPIVPVIEFDRVFYQRPLANLTSTGLWSVYADQESKMPLWSFQTKP